MTNALKYDKDLSADDLSYQDYRALAHRLAAASGLSVTAANEAGSIPGSGIFHAKMMRPRISFTPYIYNQCSADCVFCSERLFRKKAMPSTMRYSEAYAKRLRAILKDLRNVPIFLSLSGMEPLESLDVVEQNLAIFAEFERNGGQVTERVAYSNLSKAADDPDAVLDLLRKYPLSRIESSRHHFDTKTNASIMRFKPGYQVQDTQAYEHAVRLLHQHVPVKLACVLQKRGIATFQDIIEYIEWARELGVKSISFRELALLGTQVTGGASFRYILHNRQSIYPLLDNMPSALSLQSVVQGYYYFSFRFRYKDDLDVTFGVSDYDIMAGWHESDTINKLVYYPDASLCTDWNMLGRIY